MLCHALWKIYNMKGYESEMCYNINKLFQKHINKAMGKLIGKIDSSSLIILTTWLFFSNLIFLACFIIFNTLWHYVIFNMLSVNIIHVTCLMAIFANISNSLCYICVGHGTMLHTF
jgi:hypothetical protein